MRENHASISTTPNTEEPLIFADMSAKNNGPSVLRLVEIGYGILIFTR